LCRFFFVIATATAVSAQTGGAPTVTRPTSSAVSPNLSDLPTAHWAQGQNLKMVPAPKPLPPGTHIVSQVSRLSESDVDFLDESPRHPDLLAREMSAIDRAERLVVLDRSPVSRELAQRLETAASKGIVRYGLHEQDAAMMTCFTPSVMRSDHVHFIDGARGGYATAATALKAALA